MKDLPQCPHFGRGLLDTLAQSGTSTLSGGGHLVRGIGSDLLNSEAMLRRAKKKTVTQVLVLSLIDVATKKNRLEMVQSYWNTYHCQSRVITANNRLFGKYCKNRFCTLCSGVRKATLINKYLPHLETWADCHFVTLTIKAVPATELRRYFKGMLRVFARIVGKYRKRSRRMNEVRLEGIRSLECNFNPKTRTYNPHFHILVKSRQMGDLLIQEWLTRFPRKYVRPCAQYIRKVDNKLRDLIEVIKYGTKIFTEDSVNARLNGRKTSKVYVSALDNILFAMSGKRTFDRFGFDLSGRKINGPYGEKKKELVFQYESWEFQSQQADWINETNSQRLSCYRPNDDLRRILENGLDLETQ